jgi:prepilin-type N-terminal cleavage/methylation domain-containing protein
MHESSSSPDSPASRGGSTAAWSETCALPHRAGFTLIELIGVVGIIAILLGIVLSAIETVHRYSRKAVARTEVRTIEDAWKRYFDHYGRWPTSTDEEFYVAKLSVPGVYHTYRMSPAVGDAFEGRNESILARELNPDGIHFMEFTRYGSVDKEASASGDRVPVNPWYRGERLKLKETDRNVYYYVRFDVNANNMTSTDRIERAPTNADGTPPTHVTRSVIVWTYNPDAPDEDAVTSWNR